MLTWKDAIAYAETEEQFQDYISQRKLVAVVPYDNERLCLYANGCFFRVVIG